VADAYARHISRIGNRDDAIKVYGEWENRIPASRLSRSSWRNCAPAGPLPPLG
jgi:hypothetical protein